MSEDEKKVQAPPTIEDIGVNFVNGITPEGQEAKAREILRIKPESITGNAARPAMFWESITQATDPQSGARIRVWRKIEECPEYNDIEVQLAIEKIPGRATMKDVFDVISSIEGVTAIELVDHMGNGGVMYLEW